MSNAMFTPPVGFGPGSQPDVGEGGQIDYMPLPSGMRTFEGRYIEVEDPETVRPALDLLAQAADAAEALARGGAPARFDLGGLDAANLKFVAETLGEGEVAVVDNGPVRREGQESVFAGVWSIVERADDGVGRWIEVAAVPACVRGHSPVGGHARPEPWIGVVNAPPILTEIDEKSAAHTPGAEAHVVNLTLLPHTPEDLEYLAACLGAGAVSMLSKGYGDCRIDSTLTPHVWRVRFFNSMDVLILDTLEIVDAPAVAEAAPEDLQDSADRLREVLESVA